MMTKAFCRSFLVPAGLAAAWIAMSVLAPPSSVPAPETAPAAPATVPSSAQAPAATPAPMAISEPPTEALDAVVQDPAGSLFTNAERNLGDPRAAPIAVVIDPLVDRVAGTRARATQSVEARSARSSQASRASASSHSPGRP